MKRMKKLRLRIAPAALLSIVGMLLFDRTGLCAAVAAAAVFHEAGHLFAAKCMKIPLRSLRLDLLGARLDASGRMISYGEELLLALSGPLFSLLLSAVLILCGVRSGFLWDVSCSSLILGVLNLLPVRTFDGGRMLTAAVSCFWGDGAAEGIAGAASLICLFFLWGISVYFLLRAGDGISLFCFSMSLFSRFFEADKS